MGRIAVKLHFYHFGFLVAMLFFAITVDGQKLSFTTTPVNRILIGINYRYQFSAFDSVGNEIKYSCKIPSWIHFDKKNNTLTGINTKPGQYAIEIIAKTKGSLIKQYFMLTVYDRHTSNILALGNSITNGTSTFNSYRRELWRLLHVSNYDFDFIGSWDKHHMGGNTPQPDFDMDHEGHSGWTAHHILEPPDWDKQRGDLTLWLKEYTPDIVLVELGTNDVFQCVNVDSSMNDIEKIIDLFRKKNNSVKVFVAQIPPLGKQWAPQKLCGTSTDYGQSIFLYNKAIYSMAQKKTSTHSPVYVVDMFSDINPETDMYDDIHPNLKGESIMAQKWYKAIVPFLSKIN